MSRTARLIGTLALVGGVFAVSSAAQAQSNGPFQFNSLTPCRVFDTRTTNAADGTNGQRLTNPGPHNYRVQGQCSVPTGAKAATLNVTITTPNVAGDLRMFPFGAGQPLVSTLNYNANEPALANGAIVPLAQTGSGPDISIVLGMAAAVGAGQVHVIVDVTGFFQ
jgi:hypothetical protein